MSLDALTNAAIARRPDFHPAEDHPRGLRSIALAAGRMPELVVHGKTAPAASPPSDVETALKTLTTYIPTEVLTLYVAVIAALAPGKGQTGPAPGSWAAFWSFLALTPVVAWLVFAAKIKAVDPRKPLPLRLRAWPKWEMFAAATAYAAWAFALPDTPFLGEAWYSQALAGVIVLVASSLLGLIAPVMQRPLPLH